MGAHHVGYLKDEEKSPVGSFVDWKKNWNVKAQGTARRSSRISQTLENKIALEGWRSIPHSNGGKKERLRLWREDQSIYNELIFITTMIQTKIKQISAMWNATVKCRINSFLFPYCQWYL